MIYPPDIPEPDLDPSHVMWYASDADRQRQAEQRMMEVTLRLVGYDNPSFYVNVMRALARHNHLIARTSNILAATERLGSLLTTSPSWIGDPTILDALDTLLVHVRATATP